MIAPIDVGSVLVPDPCRLTLDKLTVPDVSRLVPGDSSTVPLVDGNPPAPRAGPDAVNEPGATVPERLSVAGPKLLGLKDTVKLFVPVTPPVTFRSAPVIPHVWAAVRASGRLSVSEVGKVAVEGEDSVISPEPTLRPSPEIV